MTIGVFRTNCRKSSGATSVRTITQAVRHFAWGGRANGNQLVPCGSRSKCRLRNQLVQQVWPRFRGWAAPCRGLGPGPGPSGLGPGVPGWGAGPQSGSEKSPGRGLAKGWESAETAAADVGAWREAGTGYPPYPTPVKEKEVTLSVTETIQHAPQGRRTLNLTPLILKTPAEAGAKDSYTQDREGWFRVERSGFGLGF